jgi:hypothetical protein
MNKLFLSALILVVVVSSAFAEGNVAIAVLMDISKSVPQEDLQKGKELANKLIQQAGSADTVSLYVFGKEFRKITPGELENIGSTESYTLLYDSAYDVARDLQKLQADRKAIVIITDGQDTSSATVLEDTVQFANENGIAIYAVGAGKVNRKALERISKLTGGTYYEIANPSLVKNLNSSIQAQSEVSSKEKPPAAAAPPISTAPAVQAPATPPQTETPSSGKPAPAIPAEKPRSSMNNVLWILGILGGAIVLVVFVLLIARSSRREPRICPTCGRELEDYQTICPECSKAETTLAKKPEQIPGDGTQEFGDKAQVQEDEELIPLELLEKRPMGEEDLTKTFVLMETPMLVVRKGKNLGQSYALNRAFPVSIGRSRVNEIRLDDISVSGQHCRIIPENGRHVLYDLGSTNGTLVNDKKANKVALKEGDIVKVGETQFLYKVEQHRT